MDRSGSEFVDVQWVARCAHRLRRRWPHVDVASLEEAATELWRIRRRLLATRVHG